MAEPPILQLPDADPAQLAVAIRAVVAEDRAQYARLRAGALQTVSDAPEDDGVAARRFQSLLEIGYLVASADGLADEEREGLARLLEQVCESVVDRATLELHFKDLDEAAAMMGRRERLGAAAGLLEEDDRDGALTFAAAIAMSDGWLGAEELAVLVELGGHLGVDADRVRAIAEGVVHQVEGRLR